MILLTIGKKILDDQNHAIVQAISDISQIHIMITNKFIKIFINLYYTIQFSSNIVQKLKKS